MKCRLARIRKKAKKNAGFLLWVKNTPPVVCLVDDIWKKENKLVQQVVYETPYQYRGRKMTIEAVKVELLAKLNEIEWGLDYEEWQQRKGERQPSE
jgi:hypothetical protein